MSKIDEIMRYVEDTPFAPGVEVENDVTVSELTAAYHEVSRSPLRGLSLMFLLGLARGYRAGRKEVAGV